MLYCYDGNVIVLPADRDYTNTLIPPWPQYEYIGIELVCFRKSSEAILSDGSQTTISNHHNTADVGVPAPR